MAGSGNVLPSYDISNNGFALHYASGVYQALRGDGVAYAYTEGRGVATVKYADFVVPSGDGIAQIQVNIRYANTNGSTSRASLVTSSGQQLAYTDLGDTGIDYVYDYSDPVNYPTGRLVSVNPRWADGSFTYVPPRPVRPNVANTWLVKVEQVTVNRFTYFGYSPMHWWSDKLKSGGPSMML